MLGNFFFGESRAFSERLDDVGAKGRAELAWGYRLILPGTNPRIGRVTKPSFLQLIQQAAQSSEQAARSFIGCRL
jgi:hypothetical protein